MRKWTQYRSIEVAYQPSVSDAHRTQKTTYSAYEHRYLIKRQRRFRYRLGSLLASFLWAS